MMDDDNQLLEQGFALRTLFFTLLDLGHIPLGSLPFFSLKLPFLQQFY